MSTDRASIHIGCVLLLAAVIPARAVIRTWTGGSGDWFVDTNWDPVGIPAANDSVVIDGGSVMLTNATAPLAAFSIAAGASLTFQGWDSALTADAIAIDGTLTHSAQSATATVGGVWIADQRVLIHGTHLVLGPTGRIHGNFRGYQGSPGLELSPGGGYGPGGGPNSAHFGAGASHGGVGAGNTRGAYGSLTAPIDPGSGGGAHNTTPGGHGGGAVRIAAAGSITLDGIIEVNGANLDNVGIAGGGSGGSIYITGRTVTGSGGILRANGGNRQIGNHARGGAGGRIAIAYDATAQSNIPPPSIQFMARGGRAGYGNGAPGTIHTTDTRILSADLLAEGLIICPDAWTLPALLITNGITGLSIPELTIDDDIRIAHNAELRLTMPLTTIGRDLEIITGIMRSYAPTDQIQQIHIGRHLVMTNTGSLYVYGANIPQRGDDAAYGSRIAVSDDILLDGSSRIFPYSHPTNGGSPLFLARDVVITATNSGFDANFSGYSGNDSGDGYGPGGGPYKGAHFGYGAGYGGRGGADGGLTYGLSNAPTAPGSGGGRHNAAPGGRGGGLIRIEARRHVTVNGILRANGQDPGTPGGGSGGGIYIQCHTFTGTNGWMTADGGRGGLAPHYGSGGGGGRIAIWSIYNRAETQSWQRISVNGGAGSTSPARDGQPGTIVWGQIIPPAGVMMVIR